MTGVSYRFISICLIVLATVWGNINEYSNTYIIVDGKKYYYDKNVTIDTYTLNKDARGNVRIELDNSGAVTEVFFYGIDMPEAVARFKRR